MSRLTQKDTLFAKSFMKEGLQIGDNVKTLGPFFPQRKIKKISFMLT